MKIKTFTFVSLGKQKEQIKVQEIVTANNENSFTETEISKSTGTQNVISVQVNCFTNSVVLSIYKVKLKEGKMKH